MSPNQDPAPFRLKKPSIRVLARIQLPLDDPSSLDESRDLVLRWVSHKIGARLPDAAYQHGSFVMDPPGFRAETIAYNHDALNIWALRFEHNDPDARQWITEVVSARRGDDATIGIRLICGLRQGSPEPEPSVPRLAKDIIHNIATSVDGRQLATRAVDISSETDVSNLADLIQNSDRSLPVIVVSADENGETALDPNRLAWDCAGIAHIFKINPNQTFSLSDILGRELSVWGGAVRTYVPNEPVDKGHLKSHPLKFASAIKNWDNQGETAFRPFLRNRIHSINRLDTSPHKYIYSFHEIRSFISARQIQQEEDKSNTTASQASQDQIDALNKQIEEWRSFAEEALHEQKIAEQDRDLFRSQIFAIREHLRSLQSGNLQAEGQPENYSEVADWVRKKFPDRILLLGRAERSLKDASFEDISLVIDSIELLGNEYYDMKVGSHENSSKLFEERRDQIGVQISPSITASRMGEFKKDYKVHYKGENRTLDKHVTKGTTKDDRYTMRIYFFWDDEDELIVIGHLPSHLDNRMT